MLSCVGTTRRNIPTHPQPHFEERNVGCYDRIAVCGGGILSCSTSHQTSELTAYRDYSVATKRKLVEILKFRHFAPHVVFDAEGDKYRNKRTRNYITVLVVIDLKCGNTI